MFPFSQKIILLNSLVLSLAILLDFLVGEFPEKIHPTVWIGRLEETLEPKLNCGSSLQRKVKGIFFITSMLLVFVVPTYVLSEVLLEVNWVIWSIVMVFLLKSTFALESMAGHVNPIISALEKNDLDEAREEASRIVSRNTSKLSEKQIISAAIESTSESIIDGVISPLFYFAIFGVPGAIALRVVNTMDSSIGYKYPSIKSLGWASAKLDSILNYIPARITFFYILLSSWLLKEDWKNSLEATKRDKSTTESPNSGWAMAAAAGALDIKLSKTGEYTLHKEGNDPKIHQIRDVLKIMYLSALLFSGTIILFFLGTSILIT